MTEFSEYLKRLRALGREPQWLMLLCALPLAVALHHARGATFAAGQEIEVRFSLITADKTAACAAANPIYGYSCAYRTPDRKAPRTPRPTLQPFTSAHGQLYLVHDLFAEPAVAARYASEPPPRRARRTLRRFEARCALRLLGRSTELSIRVRKKARWRGADRLWVGEARRCRIVG